MEYNECPECGNKSIQEWRTTQETKYYSVKTGKCLKTDKGGAIVCWGYVCKCGWKSETFTE